MSDQELKPCPFCGAETVDGTINHNNECFVHKLIYQHSADELEKAWQMRTPDPILEELAGALDRLLNFTAGEWLKTMDDAENVLKKYQQSKVQP